MAKSLFSSSMKTALASLVLSAGSLFGSVTAQVQELEGNTRDYLTKGSVNASALIEPPPALHSNALREQMAVVLWLQYTRTPAQVAFVSKSSIWNALPQYSAWILSTPTALNSKTRWMR